MAITITISSTLDELPLAVAPHIKTICEFIALFPEGKMHELANRFVGQLVEGYEEWELPPLLQRDPEFAFATFRRICVAMMGIGEYYNNGELKVENG